MGCWGCVRTTIQFLVTNRCMRKFVPCIYFFVMAAMVSYDVILFGVVEGPLLFWLGAKTCTYTTWDYVCSVFRWDAWECSVGWAGPRTTHAA